MRPQPAVMHRVLRGGLMSFGLSLASCLALADPMKPLTSSAAISPAAAPADASTSPPSGTSAMRLSATRSDGSGRWQALLGTRWLQRGDLVDGARVLEIDANRVLLLRGGRRETLFLLPPLSPSSAASRTSPRAAAAAAPQAPAPTSAAPF